MGIIMTEVLSCDMCGKTIPDPGAALRGPLTLRKKGVRGIGKVRELVLHPACAAKLTKNASRR